MKTDAEELVRKCEQCQKHSDFIGLPAGELKPIDSPWPFDMWGMDVVGPLPQGAGQRKFLLVAIDYFTKWIEAEPLASTTAFHVKKFLWQNIVTRFGPPHAIITDNGRQFIEEQFEEFCRTWNIQHRTTSVEHPATNGQAERANGIILEGLKKRLHEAKGKWVEELPSVLWSYRTTIHTVTGETPFALTYGHEAITPADIGVPSDRVENYSEENQQNLLVELDGTEERREAAHLRATAYRQKAYARLNRRVRERYFEEGDLVLRTAINNRRDPRHGKLAPKWEGPYRVTGKAAHGAYKLARLSGEPLPNTWNTASLRRYHS